MTVGPPRARCGMHSTPQTPPLAAILIVPLIAALVLTLFAWPSARIGPRDLPSASPARPPSAKLAAGFEVHRYALPRRGRRPSRDRGARDLRRVRRHAQGPGRFRRLRARGPVAHPCRRRRVRSRTSSPPPTPPARLAASVLPLVLAGIADRRRRRSLAGRRLRRRAGLLVDGRVLAGLAATLIVQSWLDVIGGDWLANCAALSLTVLAIAADVTGSRRCSARRASRSAR